MEENPYYKLAAAFGGEGSAEGWPVMGRVTSWPTALVPGTPHKVLVGGNTQERAALLRDDGLGEYGLAAGDEVLMLPMEEDQRYLILCKVVAV